MNPKQMKQAMQKLGIEQEDVDASKVVIHTADKRLVFTDPSVQKVDMMGQETYQVMGTPEEQTAENRNPEISDDDIQAVVNKTGCSEETAREAIEANDYDLAQAIMAVNDE
jgi:nascent polypeptide-associated complex subunit alpha